MTQLVDIIDRPDRACLGTDPELFFMETPGRLGHIEAIELCWTCPVRQPCRDYAMERPHLHGVWGGTTAQERADTRRRPEMAA